jgi:o-succinylbenzoate---CoA ligase
MSDGPPHPATEGARPLVAVDATPRVLLPHLRAAWEGGPAVLPVDPRLPTRARGALVAAMAPGGAVRDDSVVALPGLPVHDDTVVVVTTSGSTGVPRGVELSRRALEAAVRAGLARTASDPQVPWLACLPASHVGGLLVLLRSLVTGTPAIVHDGFDAAAVAAEPGPLHVALVPTMLQRLLAAGADPTRWATVLLGGARVPEALVAAVPQAVRTYGMTETCGGCAYDGVPLDGVRIAEGPGGRLRIAGPTLMTGYRPGGGGVDLDGWLTTDDVGAIRPDGRVEVLGRADDVVVTGGEKVVAGLVAARLEAHPAVAEAEVVGVPDEEWGQRVVAVVVPAQVGAVLSLALLRSFVADAMPRYAAPQDLVVVNALPRLPSGKVDRRALAASLSRGRSPAGGHPAAAGA